MDFNETKVTVLQESVLEDGFLWKARFDSTFDEDGYRRLVRSLNFLVEMWSDERLIDKEIVEAVYGIPMILENLSPHFENRRKMGGRLLEASSEIFAILGRLFQSKSPDVQ